MHFLLSNDDGFEAPGLKALAAGLAHHGRVTVVAPERDRSGASNSLTLQRPLRVRRAGDGVLVVDGTPTDCVHLALTGLVDEEPDMVIAGINAGANLGDDVIYSGTVAAAMEGRTLGYPAMAVSLAGWPVRHYATAVAVVGALLRRVQREPLPAGSILNVNVPDRPLDALRGIRATRLGQRHRAEPLIPDTDPRGRRIYWIGPPGPEADAGPGTDFAAVNDGYASVTPLAHDLTRHDALDSVSRWLGDMTADAGEG